MCLLCFFVAKLFCASLWLIFGEVVVRVTVQPAFAAFSGGDHWMTSGTRVLRRMLVGRTVATACTAALLTSAQVKPAITSLHAIFTNPLFWLLNFSNLVDVNAYFCCHPASIQSEGDNRRCDFCANSRDSNQVGHPSLMKVHRSYRPHE